MIAGGQIAQGAITDDKVGKYANIKHSKLAKAKEGEFLVAQDNGRLEAVRLSGDATLSRSGKITVKFENDDSVKKSDFKQNKTLVGGSTKPEEVAVGSGSNAIPQRDASGNLKAETSDFATNATNADTATNSTKLNNQAGTYYTDVTNHVAQSSADSVTLPTDGSALNLNTATTRRFPSKIYEAIPTVGSVTEFKIPHNFGYYPSVQVLADVNSNGDYEEIDAFVENGTTSTTIKTSEQGLTLKFILA